MKLWLRLSTCLMLLSCAGPTGARTLREEVREEVMEEVMEETPLEMPPPVRVRLSVSSSGLWAESRGRRGSGDKREEPGEREEPEEPREAPEKYVMEESLLDDYADVVELIKVTISRRHHSSSTSTTPSYTTSRTRHRRAKKRGPPTQKRTGVVGKRARGGRGKTQGCALRQVQLNVTDLALGYRSSEEMIFRYCAGPCRKSETNYDKILSNLVQSRRLPPKDRPAQTCCRPVAFDDDLSFLDDNLIYHTMRRHSARKCACV